MRIDLEAFCSRDNDRYYLTKPFTVGAFTYATNGHIIVRIDKRFDVDAAPADFPVKDPEAPLKDAETTTYQAPSFKLPRLLAPLDRCPVCDGRGNIHLCPDCNCGCETCGNTGQSNSEHDVSTTIGAANFYLPYVRQMLQLPKVEIARPVAPEVAMLFRFEGGIGALMPMRGMHARHVEIEVMNSEPMDAA